MSLDDIASEQEASAVSVGAGPEPAPAAGPSLRHNRSFQGLWTSEGLAGIGEQAAGVAYPLLILAATRSAAWAGAVGSAQLLTNGLMSFWGGVLADRVDRKRLLIVSSTIRAILLGLFCALLFLGVVNLFVMFTVAIVSAACFGLSIPPGMALIKQLVRPEQRAQANAQNQVRWFGAITVGPSIGGALYGVARALPFLGACISFTVSSLLMTLVRRPARDETPAAGKKDLLHGFRYVARDPVLRPLMVSILLSNLAFNTTGISLAVIATGVSRGASASFIGLTLSVAGSGAVVGALLSGRIIQKVRASAIFIGGYWIGPVAAVALIFVPGVIPLGIIVALVYVRGPLINALFLTYVSNTVPDEIQGRVLGAIVFSSTIVSPLGVLAIGAIFDAWGATWVFFFIAVIATLGAVPTLSRNIRSLRSLL